MTAAPQDGERPSSAPASAPAGRLVSMAAASSTTEAELAAYVQKLGAYTGETQPEKLMHVLASDVPQWEIDIPQDVKQPAAIQSRTIAGITIRGCVSCGLRVSAIAPGRGTNYADVDGDAYLQSIGRVRRAQGEEIVAFVREHQASGEWLDVGCGFGYVLEAARAAGFRVRGIEPDANAARAARERVGEVEQGVLAEPSPSADILSTLDVIEHLDDLNAFASLVKRKARALWVIKVPSSEGLFYRVAHALRIGSAVKRLWQSEYEHPHTVYFDRATLTRFLTSNGFDVIPARYLDDVPASTVIDRLTLDGHMPRWKAALAVPLFLAINFVERLRGKSDALVVLAHPRI